MHRDFACLLYRQYIENRPTQKRVHHIIAEAVKLEKEFLTEALPCSLLGMNADLMCQYIEYVADHMLLEMNLQPLYKSSNPFTFIVNLSLNGKTNFFER